MVSTPNHGIPPIPGPDKNPVCDTNYVTPTKYSEALKQELRLSNQNPGENLLSNRMTDSGISQTKPDPVHSDQVNLSPTPYVTSALCQTRVEDKKVCQK